MLKPHEIIGHYDKDGIQRLVRALGPEETPQAVGPETQDALEQLANAIGHTIGDLLQCHHCCAVCKLAGIAYTYLALGVLMAQEQAERERERLTAEIGESDGSA